MTVELAKCTRCGRDMYPCDTAPLFASAHSEELGVGAMVPRICSGCRIDLAEEAAEAKRQFYGEER